MRGSGRGSAARAGEANVGCARARCYGRIIGERPAEEVLAPCEEEEEAKEVALLWPARTITRTHAIARQLRRDMWQPRTAAPTNGSAGAGGGLKGGAV